MTIGLEAGKRKWGTGMELGVGGERGRRGPAWAAKASTVRGKERDPLPVRVTSCPVCLGLRGFVDLEAVYFEPGQPWAHRDYWSPSLLANRLLVAW